MTVAYNHDSSENSLFSFEPLVKNKGKSLNQDFAHPPDLCLEVPLDLEDEGEVINSVDSTNSHPEDLEDGGDVLYSEDEGDIIDSFDSTKSQLCIPNDRLEDIEFFPNFSDALIHLREFLPFIEHDSLKSFDDFPTMQKPRWINSMLSRDFCHEGNNSLSIPGEQEIEGETRALQDPEQTKSDKKRKTNYDEDGHTGLRDKRETKRPRSKRPFKQQRKRKCSHCESDKTPQWRKGPDGRNTLCNACGVRYRAGRLVPEYRPAASPSFDSKKHSNFHRKIVKKKSCDLFS
ncbi:hypothetical protein BUALT_Bualt04G0062900 [Buddleja alternifolia]|uniref:GATA-type domain-containing protein n=1 Tax=Buddleja alternifolia TaxID=168488 RepID=A0AAV6XT90_9LAMI|nr:hypothetical protein BUALT_Bualt04G0062900 [Buddleja alternifolia]